MSTKYKAIITEEAYFITITTVGWIAVFTRLNQKDLIVKALQYCQANKGLEIYAYCIMTSHIHLLCKATNNFILSYVMRDFKRFTSKKIIQIIQEEPESGENGCQLILEKHVNIKKKSNNLVWQNGYHAEHIYSNKFIRQKVDYIHNNPVKDKIVTLPEDYYFSSARNYASLDNDLNVILLDLF